MDNESNVKCMITGATGYLGNNLLSELLNKDYHVHALIRKKALNIRHRNLEVSHGSLMDINKIRRAIKTCDIVYHVAAYADVWSKEKSLPYKTNVIGTLNILSAALENKVKKVVFTSTAGTFPASETKNILVDESFTPPSNYFTVYEKTKKRAEELCMEYADKGLDVSIVNPTRIFGPGVFTKGNSISTLIRNYLAGKWRFIPGDGKRIANYAFAKDVVDGHILAATKGKRGEKYILGGTNLNYLQFFDILSKISGKNYRMLHVPNRFMRNYASFELYLSEILNKKPLVTPDWIKRFEQNRLVSCRKAIQDLNYKITPVEVALGETIDWLKNQNHENN